ncbi:unnamed protein product [Acanthoscelides obtectus]|uniref:Uncharacterized protein n=1 Tax=Acanthoscelides obtectus TaxID=200917 RepID=A0A9P0M963_ACAOB|nr:unnamed protein product [Acanthoscelides obtectus]CAK1631203.1 hypothetical protein AOBTE_LOCUS6812 [Acanthoscelides obtectus]
MNLTTVAPPIADWTGVTPPTEDNIPPQPLRPAPVPGVTPSTTVSASAGGVSGHPTTRRSVSCTNGVDHTRQSETSAAEKTSICPIPRPVSSINVATLLSQSSFPVCLTPPPSPAAPPPTPAATAIATPGPLTAVAPPLKLAGVYVQPKQQVCS